MSNSIKRQKLAFRELLDSTRTLTKDWIESLVRAAKIAKIGFNQFFAVMKRLFPELATQSAMFERPWKKVTV